MRCNWGRWLWGLIPLLILSWVAVRLEQGPMERDLAQRSAAALAQGGLGWAGADFVARDATLTGRAPQEGEPAKAAELLRGVWGVRQVNNRADLIEKAEPYLWWATRRNNRIRLSGSVPNVNVRHAILGVTKASFPGLEVVDRMKLSRGVPELDVWLGGVSFALKQLAALKHGDVRLENLGLGVSGEAEDGAAYRAMKLALSESLPKGIRLSGERVGPPVVSPYTWGARFAEGRLVLSGHVGEQDRAGILSAAKAPPGGAVLDQMEPGDGAPPGFLPAAIACLRELPRFETGSAELRDGALTVSGLAADAATADSVRSALRAALPASIRLSDQIRARELPPPAPVAASPQAAPAKEARGGALGSSGDASPPAAPSPLPAASSPPPEAAPPALGEPPAPPSPSAPQSPSPSALQRASPSPPPIASAPAPEPPRVVSAGDPRTRACEESLAAAAKAGTILFRLGSAELDQASSSTLDRLARAVKSCPGMRIEVGGHASAEGGLALNQRLSLRRAQSVVAYLVRAGVDAGQLEAAGFGATRPVAPNDTREHMGLNRRIEFTVHPN
jgi:outer membrane protein OmpA-like peptidoglycan-associated protein